MNFCECLVLLFVVITTEWIWNCSPQLWITTDCTFINMIENVGERLLFMLVLFSVLYNFPLSSFSLFGCCNTLGCFKYFWLVRNLWSSFCSCVDGSWRMSVFRMLPSLQHFVVIHHSFSVCRSFLQMLFKSHKKMMHFYLPWWRGTNPFSCNLDQPYVLWHYVKFGLITLDLNSMKVILWKALRPISNQLVTHLSCCFSYKQGERTSVAGSFP